MKTFLVLSLLVVMPPTTFAAEFRDASRKFQFQYDEATWEVVPEKTKPTQDVDKTMSEKTLVTVQKKEAQEKYHSRFSVVVDSLKKFPGTPQEQLAAYHKHAVEFLKGQRFSVQSSEPKTLTSLGGMAAFETVASQRDFGLTFRQLVFIHGNEAYLLTSATRLGKAEATGAETSKFFDSFRFEK